MKIQLNNEETKITHVTFIVDDSGSMGGVRNETIEGFNEQLQAVKKMETSDHKVYVSVVIFAEPDNIKLVRNRVRASEAPKLTADEYHAAGGSTALYDAINFGLSNINKEEVTKGNNAALVIIMTDGLNNSSLVIRSVGEIKARIKELTATDHYTFTYMGVGNLDEVARDYGFLSSNVASFRCGAAGASMNTASITSGIHHYASARLKGSTTYDSFYVEEEKIEPV